MARYTKVLFVVFCCVLHSNIGFAKNSVASDPQALSLAAQSIAALTAGTQLNDVTIAGTVSRTAGADIQSGSVTLYGKGQYESYLDLNLTDGHRVEIRNYAGASPKANGSRQTGR